MPYSYRVSGIMVDTSSSSADNKRDARKPLFGEINNLIQFRERIAMEKNFKKEMEKN